MRSCGADDLEITQPYVEAMSNSLPFERGTQEGGYNLVYVGCLPDGARMLDPRPATLWDVLKVAQENGITCDIVCPHGQEIARYHPNGNEVILNRHGVFDHDEELREVFELTRQEIVAKVWEGQAVKFLALDPDLPLPDAVIRGEGI